MVLLNLNITRKRALAIILIVMSIMIIDSSIVKFVAFGNKELPISVKVGIFITFSILFIGIVTVLYRFVNSKDSDTKLNQGLIVKYSNLIISLTLYSLIGILITIILQIIFMKSYNILLLFATIYISHISAVLFLIFLVLKSLDWLRTRRNKILSLYTISFTLTAFAILTSLIYATYILSYQPSTIRQTSIHMSLLNVPRSELVNSFGITLDVISLLSFISVWIASAVLLSTYSRRLGKIRYWTIICIPLIYFLFPFQTYVLNIFEPFIVNSPVLTGLVNAFVFSATKQIGALFFSFAFLAASILVLTYTVQKYLLISAIGIAILFGSIEIDSLLYAVYPPFGLVTILFMPIGSYLLFTGLSLSATHVARDKMLRKEFYKNAMSQLNLLKTIGVTEMENQIIKSHKSIKKRTVPLGIKEAQLDKNALKDMLHDVVEDMDTDDVREILHDVLTEIYAKAKIKT
jgi:hypothetical protein